MFITRGISWVCERPRQIHSWGSLHLHVTTHFRGQHENGNAIRQAIKAGLQLGRHFLLQ